MKKIETLLITLFTGTITAFAQVPNGGFENWGTFNYQGKTLTTIENWSSTNFMNVFNGEDEMVEKTTDAYEGTYAMKLTNKPNSNNVPASAYTLDDPFAEKSQEKFPVHQKVSALKGYYKYNPTPGDSFNIFILLYKNGFTMGYGSYSSSVTQSEYTSFEAPVTYDTDETPDSASITINLSYVEFHEGSELIIDALELKGMATGLSDRTPAVINASVYPNPASDHIVIRFEQQSNDPVTAIIYDILGNKAGELPSGESFHMGMNYISLNTSHLGQGIYFVKLKQGTAEKTMKISIR